MMTNCRKRLWVYLYKRPQVSVVILLARLVAILAFSALTLALVGAYTLGGL